ncbi:MAG: PadR family transcriptional regulator [Anaerolineae bacterium]|nr:PadR family transcriptional regulator [Anaerolineae bacterium]
MTNAELAILTLVAEKPRHGYEIEQVIEGRGMREWTDVGFSSIYYVLNKLAREGLIKSELEQAGQGPTRKVYRVTAAGREELYEALLAALSLPERSPSRLLLAVGNLPTVTPEEALAALGEYRERLAERLAHVRARWEAQKPLPYFVDALFDYSATLIEAEMTWIEQFATQVCEQAGEQLPGERS